jgi:hypothetical protein
VITCALDLELGEIRYYQNGEDLGVAFTKVDTTKAWYPVNFNGNYEEKKTHSDVCRRCLFQLAKAVNSYLVAPWILYGKINRYRKGKYTKKLLVH